MDGGSDFQNFSNSRFTFVRYFLSEERRGMPPYNFLKRESLIKFLQPHFINE